VCPVRFGAPGATSDLATFSPQMDAAKGMSTESICTQSESPELTGQHAGAVKAPSTNANAAEPHDE